MNIIDKKLAVIERTKNILASEQLDKLSEGLYVGKNLFLQLTTEEQTNIMAERLVKDFSTEELENRRLSADPAFILALLAILMISLQDFITDCCDPVKEKE